jgi:hypothetical protein
VIMTIPARPTEMTTRPAGTTAPPMESAPVPQNDQRPRRVLTNKP